MIALSCEAGREGVSHNVRFTQGGGSVAKNRQ
jgi:hypothetical protein